MNERGIVIVSRELGVYLGSFMGLGFWSKLDPVGQECAVVFKTEAQAREVMAAWDEPVTDARFVEVEVDQPTGVAAYASVAACVAVGLEAWDPKA